MGASCSGKRQTNGVAIVLFPFRSPAAFHSGRKLAEGIGEVSDRTFFISGGIPKAWTLASGVELVDLGFRLHRLAAIRPVWYSAILWITKMLAFQTLAAIELVRRKEQYSVLICYQGWYHQLPILIGKLLDKTVFVSALGDVRIRISAQYRAWVATICAVLAKLNFIMADHILTQSEYLLFHSEGLDPFKEKVYPIPQFVDTEAFRPTRDLNSRRNVVGFVGRFSGEKGFSELLRVIPKCLEAHPECEFLLVGDGPLGAQLAKLLAERSALATRIMWEGWVDHSSIPALLNRMRLAIIPSHTEGLPNIALEAMACGTPVLASPVGGLPGLIKNGRTGFILDRVDALHISRTIVEILRREDLSAIAQRARNLVLEEFSFEAAKDRYSELLRDVELCILPE